MNDNNIDPKRAAALRRKYGMDLPPQTNNAVVAAISRTDQMYGKLFARNSSELFDPVRNPALCEAAQKALRNLHAAMGQPVEPTGTEGLGHVVFGAGPLQPVHVDQQDDPFDEFAPLSPDDAALYVHFVGSEIAFVVRGPKAVGAFELATRGPGLPRRGVEYFAPMFRLMMELHDDFWDRECNVNISQSCGGPTDLLPYDAGAFLLVFEVCEPCMAYAGAAADTGYELSVMEAHARAGLPFP